MSRKFFALSVTVIVLLFGCNAGNMSAATLDFKLQDLNGKTVKLSDFRGRPVLIDFWATWCPPCRDLIPGVEKVHKKYRDKGLVVLGISLDEGDWDSVKSFAAQSGITYPVLKGDEDVTSQFQVRTIPLVVIINKEGRIAQRFLGVSDDVELEKIIKTVL